MSLIDGVIQAGSQVGVQCLQAVTNLTGIATGVGNASFGSAADLASWAKSSGNLSSTPQLGDIAVWGGGQGGALSAGHAGIVTGLNNGTQVTSTNWPGGAGETQYTVGAGNNPIGMGNPLGFIDPTVLGGKNIIAGQTATLTGINLNPLDPNSLDNPLTSPLSPAAPIIGAGKTGVGAITSTSGLISALTSPQTGWKILLVGGAAVAVVIGIVILLRRDLPGLPSLPSANETLPSLPSAPTPSPSPKPMTNPATDFSRSGVVGRSRASGSKFLTGE